MYIYEYVSVFIQLLNVVDDLIVSAHRGKEKNLSCDYMCSMIIIFALSLSLFLPPREKKMECIELFHWCMLRKGRFVCCNQQTNIIISRACILYMTKKERERRRNHTRSFSSLQASVCVRFGDCLTTF